MLNGSARVAMPALRSIANFVKPCLATGVEGAVTSLVASAAIAAVGAAGIGTFRLGTFAVDKGSETVGWLKSHRLAIVEISPMEEVSTIADAAPEVAQATPVVGSVIIPPASPVDGVFTPPHTTA
jgi:hypothetical protein